MLLKTSRARKEFVNKQKHEFISLSKLVDSITVDEKIAEYGARYNKGAAGYKSVSCMESLINEIIASGIVYHGDYHTLRKSQESVADILAKASEKREITLFMEMFYSVDQDKVDKFCSEKLSVQQLKQSIEESRRWSFNWNNYAPILGFAQNKSIPIIGTNSLTDSLEARDAHTAKIVARDIVIRPGRLAYVIEGEYHNAREHVPGHVQEILQSCGAGRKYIIIDQNSDDFYWPLAYRGFENQAVLKIDSDRFCIMNASPIEKVLSYLNWYDGEDEIYAKSRTAFLCEILQFAYEIGEFFGLSKDYVLNKSKCLNLYLASDLNFFDDLSSLGFCKEDKKFIKKYYCTFESRYFPVQNVMIIGNPVVSAVSEEITHWLNFLQTGYNPKRGCIDRFYETIIREALGFLGSKIFYHKRKAPDFEHFEDFANCALANRAYIARGYETVLAHKEYEEEQTRKNYRHILLRISAIAHPAEYQAVTSGLGYMLGDKLYKGFMDGQIQKEALVKLFKEPMAKAGEPQKLYFVLLKN